ncbi:MAG TPA: nucleotidyltransferase family protein [Pyrinomonadaceae bacterium]|nr:nucleotidyltransferase family protein [Pyrinomonadaceae bacterium]
MRTSGELVAALLAGSWRQQPDESALTLTDLVSVTPLLLQSGAGALAWHRLRNSALAKSPPAAELQQAYRLHAIQAALHETHLKEILKLLRYAGVEPILVKGWAIARLYPESGLRPYGDFDLSVRPDDYKLARAALRNAGDRYPVDLHKGTALLDDREWDEVFERSQLVMLDEVPVRVLAAEDHLRLLCFHWLRHGGERPIGLCDVALLLETHSAEFDWTICFGNKRNHAGWISCVIGLAQQLLNANVGEIPFPVKEKQPAWVVKSVLKAWGSSFSNHFSQVAPMEFYWHHPRGLPQALASRWPTPIVSTVGMDGSFNRLPRLPYQLGYLLLRSGRFVKQIADHSE